MRHRTADEGIHIGKLLTRDIEVYLDIDRLGRVFITGKSGSGKSYTAGVLIEELLLKRNNLTNSRLLIKSGVCFN
jgi:DNA helicase HerA-like ATPase